MDNSDLKQYIGQRLLERGFKDWFLYMFRVIYGREFEIDPIHEDIFNLMEDIHARKVKRKNLNLPPRAGKTTVCEFFIVYSYTINPRCNFIYTSYSQSLLANIAQDIINIFESDVYKQMYPHQQLELKSEEEKAVDDFWSDYWNMSESKKNIYSTKKIVTYAGGVCWFASMGSQITGVGAGVRGSDVFSGGIIVDDGNKPSDIHSLTMRQKSHKYFSETLLTRLNDSNAFVLNVQQRLNIEDLTGYLTEVYGYTSLIKPLLDENNVCQLPHQYTESRVKELQQDYDAFLAQYQQQPVPETGFLINTEKFNRYTVAPDSFDSLYICCDTAFSEKKSADESAFMLMGIKGKQRYILDVYHKRVTFVDLRRDLISFYQKALSQYGTYNNFSSIYIEAKASGISLIQQLREEGLPVQEIYPTVYNKELRKDEVKDKYTRFLEVQADIESGYVYVPEVAPWINDFLAQAVAFTGGNQAAKDDMCFVAGTKIKTIYGNKNIEDLKVGDKVITPLGIRKVLATGKRCAEIIQNIGLIGTPNHKILTFNNGLTNLCNITSRKECLLWSWKNLIIWKIKSLLFLTELNIVEWGEREAISYLMQQKQKIGKAPKDCISLYGNITTGKKYQRVIKSIIRILTHLIVVQIIWSVYHLGNIGNAIKSGLRCLDVRKNNLNIWKILESLLKNGISRRQAKLGTKNTLNKLWKSLKQLMFVKIVGKNSNCATQNHGKTKYISTTYGVQNAIRNTGRGYIDCGKGEKLTVYNLTVDGGVYFANGVLVSNCDALLYSLKVARKYNSENWEDFARVFGV